MHRQHPAGLTQRVLEAARDARHRQHEQIAERVTAQGRSLAEAVLEEPRHERLDLGQRDNVVAKVARRQDAVLTPQAARRAAIVTHGHHRGDVRGVMLEAAQHGRHARAAADADDARPALAHAELVDALEQARRVGR